MTTQIGATPPNPYVTPEAVAVAGILETTIVASLQSIATSLGPDGSVLTSVNAETYNGTIPGPTLRLNVGDTAIVRLINNLPHPSGIHWHGIELANSADGTEVTQKEIPGGVIQTLGNGVMAGGTYLYKFKVTRPGIYWYHPHHHNSSNRLFRGLYGMIVVTDPDETTLVGNTLPPAADTMQLVLSDITVCTAAPNPDAYASLVGAEWLSGAISQPGPTPAFLCESPNAVADDGSNPPGFFYPAGDVPSLTAPGGRINEGQRVLTNGVNVGGRSGTPSVPGAVALDATTHRLSVRRGQGLRLQIVNCATTRYFRLRLTDGAGQQRSLVRVGGEGGMLDNAVLEGLTPPVPAGTFDPKYDSGEIVLPPSVRADVVVAIPDTLAVGTVLTLWTRDFQRLGAGAAGGGPWAKLPTVPVMHLEVSADPPLAPAYTIAGGPNGVGGTALRAKAGFPGPLVTDIRTPPTTGSLLTPAGGFVAPKLGMSDTDIDLTSGTPSINGIVGTPLHGPPPYPNAPHIGSTRYAERGRLLQLTVTNATQAHHPFHLHGFSMQPVSLTRAGNPTFTWAYHEFRDSIDVPASYTLTFRVRLDDRPLVDGATLGGFLGRWLFHCHIFFHHHRGMIGEFVVTDSTGEERPYVDVGGSWAYVPSPVPTRTGTFSSPEGNPVSLAATYGSTGAIIGPLGTVTTGPGTWSWTYPGGVADGTYYVYITATDSVLSLQGQAVFRLKVGGLDDGSDIGDPHIRTVDGKSYDFQAVGEFTLLRDTEGLEIQVRQTPVPTAAPIVDSYSGLTSCVSINTAVAARVGPHRISYQPSAPGSRELQLFLNGKPTQLTERGIELDGGRVSAYAVGGTTALRVDYDNYTVLTVTPHFWNSHNVWYLNVDVAHTDADMGLMGRIPAKTWLPLLPSGASVGPKSAGLPKRYTALYRTFADAWRLTDQTSLFVYAPGTSTNTFTDRDWPAEKPPCKLKPEFQIPGANPPQVGIKPEVAERLCKAVTVDDLHRSCVFDVATTGDKTLVAGYLAAQEIRLKGTAVQIVADKARTEPGEAVVVTATVTAMTKGRPTPTGGITFLIDDVPAEGPTELDKWGRATWKTDSLSRGVRRIRALYAPGGKNDSFHKSSSPVLRHRVERKPPLDRSKAPYQLRGIFYEACDCYTVCPCWLGNIPDGGECTGVFAWQVEKGTIDGVDVSGLLTVSVSYHSGPREGPRQRVVIFVDDRAARQQADALAAAFGGQLGGPLTELADLQGELLGVERAAISLRRDGRLTVLTVDDRILVQGTTNEGPSRRPMALNDGKLSNVLGSPATVGESGRFRVGLAAHGMELDLRGRSTMSGRFSYKYVPGPDSSGSAPRGHG
jgi:FtsP/CotA-like multicopper oxidase with cupredoxin domain